MVSGIATNVLMEECQIIAACVERYDGTADVCRDFGIDGDVGSPHKIE